MIVCIIKMEIIEMKIRYIASIMLTLFIVIGMHSYVFKQIIERKEFMNTIIKDEMYEKKDYVLRTVEVPIVESKRGQGNEIGNRKKVAITFDDGPSERITPNILDILERYNARATFFLLGQNTLLNKNIVKRIHDSNHEIGNHSFSHKDFTSIGNDEIMQEIARTDHEIFEIIGQKPKYVRVPYGSTNHILSTMINRPLIQWSVDSKDWESKNKYSIIEEIKNGLHPGAIVLMHDIQAATAEALPDVLDYIHNEGYEIVTVSEILDYPIEPFEYYSVNDIRKK